MSKKSIKKKKRVAEQKRKIIEKKQIKSEGIKENPKKIKLKVKKKQAKSSVKEKKTKSNVKEKKTKEKSKKKKIINRTIFILFIIFLIILIYLLARPKFKDITIELGSRKEINVSDFLVSKLYIKGAKSVTDLSSINLNEVGEKDIKLKFLDKTQSVKLKIVDTTAPKVKFKDFSAYVDYQINPDDFIESKEDFSEMTVEVKNSPVIDNYGNYKVKVVVSDKYGNSVAKNVNLSITWLYDNVTVELGAGFSVENIVVNPERFGNLVDPSEIAKVDTSKVGTYEIQATDNEKVFKSVVTVQDTTPPDLQLKDITIWDDQTLTGYQDFIVSSTDLSGEVTTESPTQIQYGVVGEQIITIIATDVNGNKQEKTCKLTIQKDTTGPVIYGLTAITVNKYSGIDFNRGVYAVDNKNGTCEVACDSSRVNVNAYGTYYATYTSVDLSGNRTTSSRRITVNHDQEDLNNKINEFYNSYCAGKDPASIAVQVRDRIKYGSSFGNNDPIWYGLTNGIGNCYVHAMILQVLLQKAGYPNQLIWLQDRSHYWNLVSYNGAWRHFDSTPYSNATIGPLTDSEKAGDAVLHGKMWDVNGWPKAE